MRKLNILIVSLVGILDLSLSQNIEISNSNDAEINQVNRHIDEGEMIKPTALAPMYAIQNTNSNNIFNTDYFAPYYFSNLRGRFGNNVKGTCTYVAVDMLLSYYDSFWVDNFLPEKYDGENVFVNETVLNATQSPGSKNEASIGVNPYGLSDEAYYNLVKNHDDEIVHFDLVSRGIDKLNLYNANTKTLSLGTFLSDVRSVISDYLDESTTLSRNAISIGFQNSNQTKMRKTIVEKVKQGIPVIIDGASSGGGAHSYVAYDYDEENNEIYCNAGWYMASTYHISMSDLGYTTLQEIMYFEPTIDHEACLNYSRCDEDEDIVNICACSSMIPTEIEVSNNYLDVNPTFNWNSLIKEKWSQKDNLHHTLSILRSNKYEAFQINDIFDNKYTLTTQEWANLINDVANPSYYAYITIESDTYPYWDDYYCSQLFREPSRYLNKSSFLPSDWGFAARYYFSNELSSIHLATEPERRYTTATVNDLTITTDRLRCGFIEQSYVILSPRRENAGRAYFEMNFDSPVYSFMYRACMWSSSENLDGIAIIQTKNSSGVWTTLKDIPIFSLPVKSNGVSQFVEQTSQGIYGLRFETTAAATGTRNRGRLCLDDIVFNTHSGTSNNSYTSFDYSTKSQTNNSVIYM